MPSIINISMSYDSLGFGSEVLKAHYKGSSSPAQSPVEKFKLLWANKSSPELEKIKLSHFANRSLDLNQYDVDFYELENSKDRLYFSFKDKNLIEKLNTTDKNIEVEYERYGFSKELIPDSEFALTFEPYIPKLFNGVYERIEKDDLTVKVELNNGKTIERNITIGFDKDGYIVSTLDNIRQ